MTYTIRIILPSGKVVEQFTTGEPIDDTVRLARIVQTFYDGAVLKIRYTVSSLKILGGGSLNGTR